jgi:polygalacturonase
MKPLWLSLLLPAVAAFAEGRFDITDFGAKGDGHTLSTAAINAAVKACHDAGGGQVVVPPGTYVTGTIRLLDRVQLHLVSGATLQGSTNLADYQLDGVRRGLIFAFEARDVALTGLGTIDGNSDVFFDAKRMHGFRNPGFVRKHTRQGAAYLPPDTFFADGPIYYEQRPGAMIQMFRCERVVVENLRFLNPPEWTFRVGDCDDVLVHGITIRANLLVPNSDGIHFTTSRNVRVSDCNLMCGDDTIAVTGFGDETGAAVGNYGGPTDYPKRRMGNRTGYCENITIANCTLESASAGVRVGYGRNPIRNCVFQNLVIHNSHRGLGVFARDEGDIENLLFQGITIRTRLYSGHWWGKGEPIHVSAVRQNAAVPVGRIRRVTFSEILAEGEGGVVIYGTPESPIEDLALQNVRLKVSAGPLTKEWGGNFDLRPSAVAHEQLFQHDIPAAFVRHATGLRVRDLEVTWGTNLPEFYTSAIELEDATGRVQGFKGRAAHDGLTAIQQRRSTVEVLP